MARGILATASAPAIPGVTPASVADAYTTAYEKEPFVRLLPAGSWPQTKATLGSNAVHLQVTLDERVNRLVAVAALDNLTKGTAGGAVQCMNLALGLPETAGLTTVGLAP
jgi:N-acetyl-gamma-glutamyl-phosphate reductase